MRLAYFVREQFPTYRVDLDVLFAQELAHRDHRIDFIMQAETEAQPSGLADWHGCRVFVGGTNSGKRFHQRLHKHLLAFSHELRCLLAASRRRYDAVQVRDKIFIAAIAALVSRLRGQKFFFWLSFPISESQVIRARTGVARYRALSWARGTVSQWLLYRWVMPLSHHVFVQSEQMKQDVMTRGIPVFKLTAVPMGISSRDVRPARADLPHEESATSPSGQLVMGYIGVLSAQRNLDVLIDTLALLRRGGLNAKLLFVGEGRDPQDRLLLQRRAADLGVEQHMEITGFLPRDLALERVSAVDIGVSPFFPAPLLRSTSPTKLVEYFALGLPVVANSHPEQRLVLQDSRAGICVPWGAKYFARAVRHLAALGSAYRRTLGERGREWVVSNRTYEHIANEVDSVYRRVYAD